jgi:Domain of unknown function (DUF3291)
MYLAQLNLARLAAPLTDARLADFVAGLPKINAIADAAPGFVWRLVDDEGSDATSLRPFGTDVIVNLTVWESIDTLRAFAFKTGHLDYLRRRREWFVPFRDVYAVNWWIPVGHRPTVGEARERLDRLRNDGPTPDAFTLRTPFPSTPFPMPAG